MNLRRVTTTLLVAALIALSLPTEGHAFAGPEPLDHFDRIADLWQTIGNYLSQLSDAVVSFVSTQGATMTSGG